LHIKGGACIGTIKLDPELSPVVPHKTGARDKEKSPIYIVFLKEVSEAHSGYGPIYLN